MRFCFPGWFGPRHAGLGNELIPLAKAYIASHELGIKMLPTAWGLNDRGYRHYFGTSRFDWVRLFALSKLLPSYTFREEDYVATGKRDYAEAVRIYAEKMGLFRKRHYVLKTDGLWGEYYALRKARPHILGLLHNTRFTARHLYDFQKRIEGVQVLVAVNIRMTDFAIPTPQTDFRGLWNTRIPLEWYGNVCRTIVRRLGDAVRFYLITDGTPDELKEFIAEFRPITTFDQQNRVVSDLLLMANADALICSISSYSQWAAFLSNAPYIWYEPHLRCVNGRQCIWDYLAEPSSEFLQQTASPNRGLAVGNDGALPDWLLEHLTMRASLNRTATDLVNAGGVVSKDAARHC